MNEEIGTVVQCLSSSYSKIIFPPHPYIPIKPGAVGVFPYLKLKPETSPI